MRFNNCLDVYKQFYRQQSPIWWLYKTYLQQLTNSFFHRHWKPNRSLKQQEFKMSLERETVQSLRSRTHSLGIWLVALARRTAPGLGYGRCWNRGPEAVVSAPVFASLCLGKPLDQEPLQGWRSSRFRFKAEAWEETFQTKVKFGSGETSKHELHLGASE